MDNAKKRWNGLDLGAQWIVGTNDNPILDLAQKWNLSTLMTDWFSVALYSSTGVKLPQNHQHHIAVLLERFLREIRAYRAQEMARGAPDISLKSGIEDLLTEMCLSSMDQAELEYILATDIEHELASDLSDLSLFHWDQEGRLEGDELIILGGYKQIISRLAHHLDIRRGHVVRRITIKDNAATISTNHGDFKADRVIITVPLGTLQKHKIDFVPNLPSRKLDAIGSLSVGTLNKVFLCFPYIFWSEEDVLGFIMERGDEWQWPWLINLSKPIGKPVLLGLSAGSYGLQLETLSDKDIVGSIMGILHKLYGIAIPEPSAWYITRWASDPFSFGSYSHIPPGATSDDYAVLAEPFLDRLFFAGEATSSKFAGTVHGAYLSGLREANRILAL